MDTWYRVSFSYTITNSTTYTAKLYLQKEGGNVTLEATISNTGTLTTITTDRLVLTAGANAGSNWVEYFDEVYVDDRSDFTDCGAIAVTAKLPNANNTNSFDTAIGANPANRWTNVNERPISQTNGWEQAAIRPVQENYGLESASQGDTDITGLAILAHSAWVYGKRSAADALTKQTSANNTGSAVGTTMTLGPVTVEVGQLMVVAFADRVGGGTPTIADNLDGNAWTLLNGPATSTVRQTNWFKVATTRGSLTATITFTSSSAKRAGEIGVMTYTDAWSLDKDIAQAADSTSPFDCPSTGTLSNANEVVFGFRANATTGTMSATSPDLLMDSAATTGGSSTGSGMSYRVVAATTAVAPQMTGTAAAGENGTASFVAGTGIGDPKIMDNGSESSITLTTTASVFTHITDSTSYPSNAAGIGMKSGGNTADAFLYDCGMMVAYFDPYKISVSNNLALTDLPVLSSSALFNRSFSDSLALTDTPLINETFLRLLADTIALRDVPLYKPNYLTFAHENLGLTDTVQSQLVFFRQIADSMALVDTALLQVAGAITRQFSEFMALTDSVTRQAELFRQLSELMGLSDAFFRKADANRVFSDALGFRDTPSRSALNLRAIAEFLGITDLPTRATLTNRQLTDSLALADSVLRSCLNLRRILDSMALTDTPLVTGAGVVARTISDALGLVDSITRQALYFRQLVELLGIKDTPTRQANAVRAISEQLGLVDTPFRQGLYFKQFAEAIGLSDLVLRKADANRTIRDNLAAFDLAQRALIALRSIAESLGFTDVANVGKAGLAFPMWVEEAELALCGADTAQANFSGVDELQEEFTGADAAQTGFAVDEAQEGLSGPEALQF